MVNLSRKSIASHPCSVRLANSTINITQKHNQIKSKTQAPTPRTSPSPLSPLKHVYKISHLASGLLNRFADFPDRTTTFDSFISHLPNNWSPLSRRYCTPLFQRKHSYDGQFALWSRHTAPFFASGLLDARSRA